KFKNLNSKNYVAKWDGTTWTELGTGANALNANNYILTLALDTFNNVYAAGDFTDGNGVNYVAKWNGTNWVELGPNGINAWASATIRSIVVDNIGNVYAGGDFLNSNWQWYVAKWNGSNWSQLGTEQNGNIHALSLDRFDNVYKTDSYFKIISKWDGVSWKSLGAPPSTSLILSIVVDDFGIVYSGGSFKNANNKYYIAKFDGINWTELGSDTNALNANNWVKSITRDKFNNLYAAGFFTDQNDRGYVAKWTSAPEVKSPLVYCQNSNSYPLTATTSGTTLKWYSTSISGTALNSAPIPVTTSVGSMFYYVSQVINGYEGFRNKIEVKVLPQTVIVLHPKDTTLCSGNLCQFTLSATGIGLNYHWSEGTIGQILLTSVAGIYTATVSGTCGTSISNHATLTFLPQTNITSEPVSTTACIDSSAFFAVFATGSGLNYQWSNGKNTPTLTTSVPGIYTVTISGICGTVVSNSVQLSSTNTCTGTVTNVDNGLKGVPFQVFPNPTNGFVTIHSDAPCDFKIIDGVGGFIKNGFFNQGKTTINLELTQGIYYFISHGEVKKLVVN
ncbi:MAG: hypothetical protein K2Q22_13155, partial [Cytophagales bacterium]|nr:hypothetical protein [Cytophagales bacterium]